MSFIGFCQGHVSIICRTYNSRKGNTPCPKQIYMSVKNVIPRRAWLSPTKRKRAPSFERIPFFRKPLLQRH